MTGPDGEAAYWRERALALEKELAAARARLLALARSAPVETVTLLGVDPAALSRRAATADVFEGWEDTVYVRTSDVATELAGLWERLGRDAAPAR
ncbi:MAG: hypothetical protein ACYC4P_15330 [Thermoanaerobaculia bacterium]